MPPTFLEPETLLLALCNLMRSARKREAAAPATEPALAK
jgi:hypothetical protein